MSFPVNEVSLTNGFFFVILYFPYLDFNSRAYIQTKNNRTPILIDSNKTIDFQKLYFII